MSSALVPLRNHDYRLYFVGQCASAVGNNAQKVALGWLTLEVTSSGTSVGVVVALGFAPLLLFGLYAGAVADRLDRRSLMMATQTAGLLISSALWLTTVVAGPSFVVMAAAAFALGTAEAFDFPARRGLVHEVMPAEHLTGALALNNSLYGIARIVGPLCAAALLAVSDGSVVFLFNLASFAVMLLALRAMSVGRRTLNFSASSNDFASVWRYLSSTASVRAAMLSVVFIGALTYQYWVTFPVLARETYSSSAAGYSWLLASMSTGCVVGGLAVAHVASVGRRHLVGSVVAFGASGVAMAAAPSLAVACGVAFVMGVAYSAFVTWDGALIQADAPTHYQGRLTALWNIAFCASAGIASPAVGWISSAHGVRWGLLLGGVGAAMALVAIRVTWRSSPTPASSPVQPSDELSRRSEVHQNSSLDRSAVRAGTGDRRSGVPTSP